MSVVSPKVPVSEKWSIGFFGYFGVFLGIAWWVVLGGVGRPNPCDIHDTGFMAQIGPISPVGSSGSAQYRPA